MNQPPALVILAAGMGSRYGRLKQFDPIGPTGATLMDYAVFDARRAGFGKLVFVIRDELDAAFAEYSRARHLDTGAIGIAHQRLERLPPGTARNKPWGTAHAVLSTTPHINCPFAVVNADDFYGRAAYEAAAHFLGDWDREWMPREWAVIGYRLRDTLSAEGGVNRGLLDVTSDGLLRRIDEVTGIQRDDKRFTGDERVSMNMWCFTPALLDTLRRDFARFLENANLATDEFLLPDAVGRAIDAGEAHVHVLDGGATWLGVSYPGDREPAAAALRKLTAAGEYPGRLW